MSIKTKHSFVNEKIITNCSCFVYHCIVATCQIFVAEGQCVLYSALFSLIYLLEHHFTSAFISIGNHQNISSDSDQCWEATSLLWTHSKLLTLSQKETYFSHLYAWSCSFSHDLQLMPIGGRQEHSWTSISAPSSSWQTNIECSSLHMLNQSSCWSPVPFFPKILKRHNFNHTSGAV